MIGKLTGRIDYRADDHILLDVKGVGYLVYCSERTLMALPRDQEFVALYTDLIVREDLLQLFGFLNLQEREWHRLLMSVQGIGAKASLAILSALGVDGVANAVALGDWNALKSAKGVGPKTAQRVANELKDKAPLVMARLSPVSEAHPLSVESSDEIDALSSTIEDTTASPKAPRETKAAMADQSVSAARADAMSALGNLGYAPSDAARAVARVIEDQGVKNTSDLIREALKLLAPKET